MDDRQAEVGKEKQPYSPPMLERLGSVKHVTKGFPIVPVPDYGGISY
jgi:hypothetical protein